MTHPVSLVKAIDHIVNGANEALGAAALSSLRLLGGLGAAVGRIGTEQGL